MNHDNRRPISAEDRARAIATFSALDERRDPFGRDDSALDAYVTQLETGIISLSQWVTDYFIGVGRVALAVEIAGERFVKLRAKADRAKSIYDRNFASPPEQPELTPVGFTDESASLSTGLTPDTRVYAIRASFPLERTPITSQAEFNDYAEDVRKEPSCDFQFNGPLCNQMLRRLHSNGRFDFLLSQPDYDGWPNAIPVPYVRGDVVVWLSICRDCLYFYYQKWGITKPEIIDPDDVID
ncbi:hypothetical protein [Mycolicibacterium fortuitum]|uniref:Uncharacterized protein n=2 Tax=Mycolicibacterium fortuitum TaxID=1766 RepID=A0AAE5AHB5_MYCFO|nr:hypothetical protein [Mycolicibacterium fortuitum]MCV7139980.1 hypothetical protein [Mycolicibacterium fortuitum]MDV7195477.1 hypothetical protein [Mycolicibacterium fortuitum]MDV7209379.1 hypothetical protein [Mycolicibacterium fortuitum]MDV7231226.1 hypothetical protein [Mycolicibacterium fortuitum]MDV7262596.1 hypothetical protein [Mycolicibacterium fortuitum]